MGGVPSLQGGYIPIPLTKYSNNKCVYMQLGAVLIIL